MTLHFNREHIVWNEFGGLEHPKEEWRDQFEYWRDYNFKFFESNGLQFDPADDNVEAWLMANDRAPFADMVGALLPDLKSRTKLEHVDAILMAHWLPDIHLGTSVTNFLMHRLGVENCFGFAISDRGLSAPFFAFDCLCKYLAAGRRSGILAIADQKHIMYRSELVDRLKPVNSACLLHVDLSSEGGMRYAGYARRIDVAEGASAQAITDIIIELGLSLDTTRLIGSEEVLHGAHQHAEHVATRPELVCSAPFAAFAEISSSASDTLLLCRDGQCITALGFAGATS